MKYYQWIIFDFMVSVATYGKRLQPNLEGETMLAP